MMPVAVLGTAHLYGATDVVTSDAVLDAAWDVGFRAFDTAPSYGHGRSEAALGVRIRQRSEQQQLTSKVGLAAAPPAGRGVRLAKSAARRLPGPVQRRLRPGGDAAPHGTFDPASVARSVEATLARLGRVDRLMLHEAHAEDLSDEVLGLLATYVARGDVGALGVATVNEAAAAVVARADGLVTAAHVAVGPYATPVDLPATVTAVVGHGALGPGASGLRRVAAWTAGGAPDAVRWWDVTAGTRWAGDDGLAAALVARAAALPLSDVIVASSRTGRLADLHALASGDVRLPDDVATALAALVRSSDPTPTDS